MNKDLAKQLKIIPFYTGVETLEKALRDKKSSNLLWLEILLNDNVDWESYLNTEKIKVAYEKACVWYSNFKTVVESYIRRKPLKIKKDRIDSREYNQEYRKFLEVLNFVAA